MVYLFAPQYGQRSIWEQYVSAKGMMPVFIMFPCRIVFISTALCLKLPLYHSFGSYFLMTAHPSQFVVSNQFSILIKCYSVSLTLRYIPDLQRVLSS